MESVCVHVCMCVHVCIQHVSTTHTHISFYTHPHLLPKPMTAGLSNSRAQSDGSSSAQGHVHVCARARLARGQSVIVCTCPRPVSSCGRVGKCSLETNAAFVSRRQSLGACYFPRIPSRFGKKQTTLLDIP